ncbi:hypothetical protein COU78_01380 [Candidatus Peregrinibacteria bacterium CG10_big_fil_rev_8_21_14_0_10_49_24]|nr:MAG: hypothetical protein COV83_04345 [Candidatus Peregrinibacteria bacterium CG11_big_fil_rev_8_21_14_0_20_49_14]PIR51377.1 MAG: hypothetical protein COU78_01380 [Candidatus Peregrinibacteria bacterium CG10_big_fil_rev_8_21_14_0_10_49_24]PJA68141.1 MAG: hypothetical protein CO157_01195 [Candidatus Peregrinibacteria bacterium CG_4_9_14_3_um_filter_49_12]
MPPERQERENITLPPVSADVAMPDFLVEAGYKPNAVPRVRIEGHKNSVSYNFRFQANLQDGCIIEQVENLLEHRGATGSIGYVRREAERYMRDILSGAALVRSSQRKRPAA